MVGIITVAMVREQLKKIDFKALFSDRKKLQKNLLIAMMVMLAIIAIILISLNNDRIKNSIVYNDVNSVSVVESTDQSLINFVYHYYAAKTNLNYQKIFEAFGRDYYKEEREDKDGSFKKIIDNLRYERIFVKSYDNIKVYECRGYRPNEKVLIVVFDMQLGFTDIPAPMIVMFYLEDNNGKYIIKDNLDVGTSKYIVAVSENEFVKKLYEDVKVSLERAAAGSESLRLSYNTLRQIEVNQNIDMGSIDKKELIDKLNPKGTDLVKDARKIYDEIVEQNEERAAKEKLDNYLERIKASFSEASIINGYSN